jgi:hypothetical protein
MLEGKRILSTSFFPMPSRKLVDGEAVHWLAPNSFNPLIAKMHRQIVEAYDTFPPLEDRMTARHYRHVALTSMHAVGCAHEAKRLHMPGSTQFEQSYHIDSLHPDFANRLQVVAEASAFAELRACERLML